MVLSEQGPRRGVSRRDGELHLLQWGGTGPKGHSTGDTTPSGCRVSDRTDPSVARPSISTKSSQVDPSSVLGKEDLPKNRGYVSEQVGRDR